MEMGLFSSLSRQPLVLSMDVAAIAEVNWLDLRTILSPAECIRADAFVHEADRRSFIAAHALLRLSLAAALGAAPSALGFTANAYGKPELAGWYAKADLQFNLSHSRRMVVIGLARGVAIGVDTEISGRMAEADLAAVTRSFAPAERDYLDRFAGVDRARRSVEMWTLKEAVIKAAGLGLSIPLDSFSVDVGGFSVDGLAGPWSLAAWTAQDQYIAAALMGASSAPRYVRVVITKSAARLRIIEVLGTIFEGES